MRSGTSNSNNRKSNKVKINEAILEELRSQAIRQSRRNYRQVEVDCRILLALIHEIERGRLVNLQFERPSEPCVRD